MISIIRSPTLPASLRRYQAKWTLELCNERRAYYRRFRSPAVASGRAVAPKKPRANPRRYASKSVKRALQACFGNWCAYCGDILGANSFPRADHFRPQAIYPVLAYEWMNLIQACEICNERKGDKFELMDGTQPVENERSPCAPRAGEANALIDPCVDNPDEHFAWDRHDVRPLSQRGNVTCTTVDLRREGLVDQREAEMNAFEVFLRIYQMAVRTGGTQTEIDEAKQKVVRSLGPAGRFPAMKRAALARAGLALHDFLP